MESAVKRRIPKYQDTLFISLSGGLDSSIIALYLKRYFQWTIIAYSFQSEKNEEDIHIAQKNARTLWIKHYIIPWESLEEDIQAHEGMAKLPNLYKVLRESIPEYTWVKVEFWGDGKEELFFSNTHFDIEKIQNRYKTLQNSLVKYTINSKFLNRSMLDYNLQMIDKLSLRCGIERRMPFLDYELLQFENYTDYESDVKDILEGENLEYSSKKYGYSDGIKFSSYDENTLLSKAKKMLDFLKSNI